LIKFKWPITSEFGANVVTLVSGTALAHLATFIATPFLTRMFSMQSLGDLQIFISTVMTFGVVASLKFEMAIVLPKQDDEADKIAVLSLVSLVLFSSSFTAVLVFAGDAILHFFKAESLHPYLYFIALGVFLFGLWQALQYILVRRKKFGVLARNKIAQVVVTNILAVGLGLFWQKTIVLLIAQLLGYGVAAVLILRHWPPRTCTGLKELARLAWRYKKFPTVNTAMVFLNTLSLQLPVFVLSRYFGTEVVALYSMANRIVNIPLFMVGRSVQQVYFQSASEAMHKGRDALLVVYKSTVKKLALFAIAPLGILLVFGPQIAKIYFGAAYAEAGVYMQIVTFWMFFQFINSPISATFTIIDKQQIGFYLVLLSLILRLAAMMVFSHSAREMLIALSIAAGLFYFAYNISIYYFIKRLKE
jgi:lipopolysaccharide exporter